MAYYTLCTRGVGFRLHPQFGDSNRKVVLDEKRDAYRGQVTVIVRSNTAHKADVDRAIGDMETFLEKTSPLTIADQTILAAIFARSNLGMALPDTSLVQRAKTGNPTLESSVVLFCGEFMESEEHEEMFLLEAKGWLRQLKRMSREKIKSTWPDIGTLYFGAGK